jgi:hypothetical protein
MYCNETTNATNIPVGTNIPLDNRNRSAKRCRKIPPFWPPAAILNLFQNHLTNLRQTGVILFRIAINSGYTTIVIKVKVDGSRHLDFTGMS